MPRAKRCFIAGAQIASSVALRLLLLFVCIAVLWSQSDVYFKLTDLNGRFDATAGRNFSDVRMGLSQNIEHLPA